MVILDALSLSMRPALEPPVKIVFNHMAIQLYPYLWISQLERKYIYTWYKWCYVTQSVGSMELENRTTGNIARMACQRVLLEAGCHIVQPQCVISQTGHNLPTVG